MFMSNLRDLYQEIIIDHSKHPRNFCVCKDANHIEEGYNPLCGDKIKLYVKVNEDTNTIEDVCFEGVGCAISTASASLMTEAIKGKTIAQALELFEDFQKLVTAPNDAEHEATNEILAAKIGKLAVLRGVAEFPMRIKCATLAWHTLKAALEH
jgi:nitrogen fixation protein NifU and related proteins